MPKKWLQITLSCILFVSVSTAAVSQIDNKTIADLYSQIELFSYALTTIQSEYVDEKTPQDLIYGSLQGMLGALDPHSQFLTPDDYKDLKTETQGKFGGLGIEISIRDGLLTVVTPIEDTPAWRVGMQAGDRIVKIEDELTKDITLSDAVKKLRGEPGTEVNVTVLREREFKLHDFSIVREIIRIQDVKDPQILTDNIGYVRLTEFREDSHHEIHKVLAELRKEGANSLIFDLRNNPGGLLNIAISITEEFLPEGQVIVSTKGRRESQTMITKSEASPDKILDWPIVIMINEGSASGSEILAGALQDNKRAVILGTQSFGKGSVQSVIPLPDGSGLRLTTSKYFTPSGRSIHGKGITPDVDVDRIYPEEEDEVDENGKKEKKIEEVFENIKTEEIENKQKADIEKKQHEARKRLLEDNQVQSAISVIKGIRIFKEFDTTG